jgi:hypothetical protein
MDSKGFDSSSDAGVEDGGGADGGVARERNKKSSRGGWRWGVPSSELGRVKGAIGSGVSSV